MRVVRKSSASTALAARVAQALKPVAPRGARVTLGLSGGVDSTVLLDLLARQAKRAGWKLRAVHINHQLSPNAAKWATFCRRACIERGVLLRVVKVNVKRGNSTEAAARAARYAVYRAQPADCIVLAHNQDDQAETLLLQLLRGSGVKGLAAMPAVRVDVVRPALKIARPLLDVPRREIESYAQVRKLQWITDESNADQHYLRNFLRAEVLPRIASRAPRYREALTRAAGHFAEAAQLLDQLALIDAKKYVKKQILMMDGLRSLDAARGKNLLRYFLALHGVTMPDAVRLDEAMRQARSAKADAKLCIDLGAHELRCYNQALHVVRKTSLPPGDFLLEWKGQRVLRVEALGGELRMARSSLAGIDKKLLMTEKVTLRLRRGGEKLQPDAKRPRRAVKDLLQEHGVAPWQRDRLPFLWSGEQLVWVPGLGIDCRFQADPGRAACLPVWKVLM